MTAAPRGGVHVRLAGAADAEALLALQHRLDAQSAFMLLEPGEREATPDGLRARLEAQDSLGSFDVVAEAPSGELVGWAAVEVLPYRRAAGTGYLVLGVDQDAAGRGVGRSLMDLAVMEAARRGLVRLELTVMTDNVRALTVYARQGFQVEGLRRRALRRDGRPVDEYYMALLLPD